MGDELNHLTEEPTQQVPHERVVMRIDLPQMQKISTLIGGIRSINKADYHKVKIDGDDEPCFWQRKEWIDWILEMADEAEKAVLSAEADRA